MTPEQNRKIAKIEEKLLDVFIAEADPDAWPQARGDRYWSAKIANQTISLLTRIEAYRQKILDGGKPVSGDDEGKHSNDMREAEKKVKGRLALVKKRAA